MTQLSSVIHYYLGCELKSETGSVTLVGVIVEKIPCTSFGIVVLNGNVTHRADLSDLKPILLPLSSMGEQEIIELCKIYSPLQFEGHREKNWKVEVEKNGEYTYFTVKNDKNIYSFNIDCKEQSLEKYQDGELCESYNMANCFHYLLSRGYDLFSLIESGQAVDKTQIK